MSQNTLKDRVLQKIDLSNIKTKPKVLLSVAVPLVFSLCLGAIALFSLERMNKAQNLVDHTQRVLTAATEINVLAANMETGMRGYLLAGREGFLGPYEAGSTAVFSALDDLRETVSDNPPQMAKLAQAAEVLRDWQTTVAEPQIALRRAIGDAPTMNDIAAEVAKGEGNKHFTAFRALIATFVANEREKLRKHLLLYEKINSSGYATVKDVQDAMDASERTNTVVSKGYEVLAAAVDAETGMRGFLIAGDPAFLDPFNKGYAAFHDLVTELRSAITANPDQVAILDEAEATFDRWFTEVASPMMNLRRQIGDAATMDDMADLVGEARGKAFFDNFRAIMTAFSAEESALMVTRRETSAQARSFAVVAILVFMAAATVLGIGFALWVGNNIGGAVRNLTLLMGRLADGDNDVEITGQSRRDEIGEMARATEVFKQNALKVAALNAQQEADSKRMAELAAEREQSAQREIALAKQKDEADSKAAQDREAMMRHLGKSFGAVVQGATNGEFFHRVEAEFADEILNELAVNINQLLDTVDQGLSCTGQTLERVALGDLSSPMAGSFKGAFGQLQHNVNDMIRALAHLISDISGSGTTLATTSAELRDTATQLSERAEQNASALEETSSAVEELSASIQQVSSSVQEASNNAQTARDTAHSSEQVATDAATSMERISEASQEISRVVGVIDEIAFQINLLALNAGVEAARAGEAGRGFAVVASEVRQLAQHASTAATEIGTVIAQCDGAVLEGVAKVSDARSSLEDIAACVVKISGNVDDVSTAVHEQVNVVSEITTAVARIDQSSQRQLESFGTVTATSRLLAGEAEGLLHSTGNFQTDAAPAQEDGTQTAEDKAA